MHVSSDGDGVEARRYAIWSSLSKLVENSENYAEAHIGKLVGLKSGKLTRLKTEILTLLAEQDERSADNNKELSRRGIFARVQASEGGFHNAVTELETEGWISRRLQRKVGDMVRLNPSRRNEAVDLVNQLKRAKTACLDRLSAEDLSALELVLGKLAVAPPTNIRTGKGNMMAAHQQADHKAITATSMSDVATNGFACGHDGSCDAGQADVEFEHRYARMLKEQEDTELFYEKSEWDPR